MRGNKEDKRRIFGWLMYDWANSAYVTTVAVAVLPAYFAAVVVPPDGFRIGESAFSASCLWGYLVSATALLVFLLAPFLGAVADFSGQKKRFLGIACLVGSVSAGLLFFSGPGMVWLTMFLFALAHAAFVGGNVFYDAFLPHITTKDQYDRVSGRGYAYGYVGGGLQFALSLALIAGHARLGLTEGQAARVAMVFAALWWGGFSIITFTRLNEPKGQSLPGSPKGLARAAAYAGIGVSRLLKTTREARRIPGLLPFLLAFLFYNDGIQTVIAMATIYGKTELGLSSTVLMVTLLMIQFVAVFGALVFSGLAQKISSRGALMVALFLWAGVAVYAYFMRTPTEYFIMGGVVGLVLGGSQALSRSLYARLIPKSASAEYFGYFSVVGRLSAVVGPFVFAAVTQATGSSRAAVLSLVVFFAVGMVLLWRVRVVE
ncbi:MAG: MFS transporter [Thermodesulfobacteriota bacterium]|nr:MFS transporter [Thermodesulfobacteriota bacterium]